jgi:hypothetical protein
MPQTKINGAGEQFIRITMLCFPAGSNLAFNEPSKMVKLAHGLSARRVGFWADAFSYSLHALALPPQPRPILVASRHSTLDCVLKIGRCTTATYLSIVQMNGAVKQVFPARTFNSYRASRFIPNL